MSIRKILAGVAGLAMLGGAAFGTVSASAAGALPDTVSCAFQGSTTSLTPIPNAQAFAPSNENPTAEEGTAPFTTADHGFYTFLGPTVGCTGTDSNGNTESAASITSSGEYYNIVCGTGTAFGTATLWTGPNGTGSAVATVSYTIVFTGGQGTLRADVTIASDGVTIDANGTVTITPANTGGCATAPVTGFNVDGTSIGSGTGDTDGA